MGGPIVECSGVHKVYTTGNVRVHALRGIDLNIERGEMIALMGPSGCGKTTLLNCLSGLDDITRGRVLIKGTDIHRMSERRRSAYRARRMGFVFQAYNLLPVLTAVENVELPLLLVGTDEKRARKKAMRALDLVGLAKRAHHKPMELSGGEQQRAAIARALVNDPTIIWADEPTGNLDSDTSADVMSLMIRLNREKGSTFLIVTHDPSVARGAHRILKMRDGKITS